MIFYLFDRWGEQLGTILGVMRAVRSCEINGVHKLTLTTPSYLDKGQRVLYKDTRGKYREFVVQEITEDHDESDCVITTALCEDSICELNGDYLEDKRPSGTASAALVVALAPSRWKVGTVDVTGTQKMSFYHCSVREAICEIAEAYKSEVSAEIVVSGGYVVERRVNILKRIGSDNGKRFAYRKDLASISRTVEIDDVISALYGFGKGLEQVDDTGEATGGYDRKLTFGRINGGLDYVADSTARELWGRPDVNGGKAHVFGRVEFSDCEDMQELLSLTNSELTRRTTPRVSYTANVVNLAAGGFVVEGCSEGDSVQIVDTAFAKPLRLVGRVLKIDEDLLAPEETVITLGNIQPSIDSTLMDYGKSLKNFNDHASSWDGAASVSSSYINAVVKRLNEEFDAGGSYKYEAFEVGTIYSSVPLDANFKPTKTPASAYQLTGGGFRIASSVKANG
ncbi:MAG: phage tail spike protein, partial [Gordonibacter sp.]|uniref:phage tail spike protein n=1 Tax=Gordonibacter sp. TaxID=1968902 RepID=UPI002FC9CEAF